MVPLSRFNWVDPTGCQIPYQLAEAWDERAKNTAICWFHQLHAGNITETKLLHDAIHSVEHKTRVLHEWSSAAQAEHCNTTQYHFYMHATLELKMLNNLEWNGNAWREKNNNSSSVWNNVIAHFHSLLKGLVQPKWKLVHVLLTLEAS